MEYIKEKETMQQTFIVLMYFQRNTHVWRNAYVNLFVCGICLCVNFEQLKP